MKTNNQKTKYKNERVTRRPRILTTIIVFILCISTFTMGVYASTLTASYTGGSKLKVVTTYTWSGSATATTAKLAISSVKASSNSSYGFNITNQITANGAGKNHSGSTTYKIRNGTCSTSYSATWSDYTRSTANQTVTLKSAVTSSEYGKPSNSVKLTSNARQYYSCSCNANGGSGGGTVGGYYGYTVYLPGAPTRTGYTFTGWGGYGAGAGIAAQNLPGSLTAGWSINQYYLDVNGWLDGASNGGISPYGTCDVYINGGLVSNDCGDFCTAYNYGSSYSISDIKANPGYVYNGVYSGSTSGTIGAGTVNVYLSFSRKLGTLSYNANGHGTMPANVTMDYWTAYTAADAPENPEGYVFKEWNTKADGTGTSYAPGAQVKAANTDANNITLYAIWKHPGTITITKTWDDDLQGSDQNSREEPEITIKGERVPQ